MIICEYIMYDYVICDYIEPLLYLKSSKIKREDFKQFICKKSFLKVGVIIYHNRTNKKMVHERIFSVMSLLWEVYVLFFISLLKLKHCKSLFYKIKNNPLVI